MYVPSGTVETCEVVVGITVAEMDQNAYNKFAGINYLHIVSVLQYSLQALLDHAH